MKNNTNYFSHDCNARDDEKIMLLRAEYGWEGYGIWWLMVEKLSEATDYKLLLSNKLVISKLYLANIDVINYLFELGLLVEDGEYMYSPSLLYRMKLRLDKKLRQSEGGKKAMLKRWENKSGSGSDKLLITSKVKESKEYYLYINNIYKSEQDIKDRVYELYDKEVVSKNISKYKLLVLFATKGYDKIKDDIQGCEKFFTDMIDKSNRYGYSSPGFADWDTLLLKAKEMYEWAEGGTREMKNHMSTINKFLAPNTKK